MNTILRSPLVRTYFASIACRQCGLGYRCATTKPKKYRAFGAARVQNATVDAGIERRPI